MKTSCSPPKRPERCGTGVSTSPHPPGHGGSRAKEDREQTTYRRDEINAKDVKQLTTGPSHVHFGRWDPPMSDETPTDGAKVKAGDCGTPKTEPHTAEELKGTQATAPAQEIPASPTHETDDKPAEPSALHDNQAIEDEGKPAEKPTTDGIWRRRRRMPRTWPRLHLRQGESAEAAENRNLSDTPRVRRAGGPFIVVDRSRIFQR